MQQLSVYSDYNNIDHGNGNVIEANTFQEQIVGAADVGSTWLFQFDAKRGNIELGSQAAAFIKTLDPNAGFALTNLISADMTNIPDTWNNYLLSIYIDPSLDGQILQFGFLNTATNYEGSGVFYDNINFRDLTNQCPSAAGEDDTETDDSESGDLFLGSDSIVGSTDSGLLDLNFNHEVSNEQNTTTGNVERDRAKRRGR